VSYEDWSQEHRDLFDYTTETYAEDLRFDSMAREYMEDLYERGFTVYSADYDTYGLTPAEVELAREEYFDYLEMTEDDFDWDAWRDAMGYD
jgi:hypothetical protein